MPRPNDAQCLTPFEVGVGNVEGFVEAFELGVEQGVLVLLPVLSRRVAKENAAAEGADGVDGAEAIDVEGAALAVPGGYRFGGGRAGDKGGKLKGGDVKAVAELFETAAAAGGVAAGAAGVNGLLERFVDARDGLDHLGAGCGGKDNVAELVSCVHW